MSQRTKRQNRFDNDEPLPTKRRKGRPPTKGKIPPSTAVDDDEDGATSSTWQPRPIIDLKISSIYNRSAPEAPAELFRKDLISAMKLPDSEPLAADEYWAITDQWKQEWERGVQVPVNPDSLPEPAVSAKQHESFYTGRQDFKLPKNKFIRITKDENFSSEQHYLSNTPAMAEAACAYDLDQFDDTWLKIINGERALAGAPSITEDQFERVIEELEVRCWDKIQAMVKSEQGLGIEYDENVICDVCRSPDSEEANEMVFCDSCNICVHQACYGITAIPSGQWLCRTCSMGNIRPDCVLCPNKGGAMKSTRSGHKWAHVSCALWIPEVSIGSVDRMEPITKISSIPASRWALICVLCRERVGACIQCSVKTCKTAYHVTCAFQHGLEMRAIIEDENAEDGVKLRSYCQKHSLNKSKKDKGPSNNNAGKSGSDEEDTKRKKQRRDMTSEEKTIVRKKRVQEIEAEFEKHVNIRDISCHLMDVDQEAIYCIYNYWIIKRKSLRNESLIPHKWDDVDMVEHKHEPADIEKMKMFVHLRQDLERVRNLCYMVSRREKLSRSFFKMREQTFHKQISVLNEIKSNKLDDSVIKAVCRANNVRSVYDKAYSSDKSVILKLESILSGITGSGSASSSPAADDRVNNIDFNGQLKAKRQLAQSTNKRTHLNGVSVSSMPMSSIMFDSVYDTFSSESDFDAAKSIKSSKSTTPSIRKKATAQKPLEKDWATKTDRRKQRRVSAVSINRMKKTLDSSSDDDQLLVNEKRTPKNRSLRQMERELNRSKASGSESDELIPIRNSSGQHIGSASDSKKILTAIYSDSEESTDKEKTDHTASDSQQHSFRTKAAMKEFNVNSAKLLRDKDEEASRIPMPKEIVKEKEVEESKKKNERDTKVGKEVKNKRNNSTQDVSHTVQKDKKLDKDKLVEKLENEPPEIKTKKTDTKKDKPSDIPVDLLVVPQRKAAKKASENMMRTTVPAPGKKDTKDDEKEKKDLKEPAKEIEKETTQQEPEVTPTKAPITPQRPKGRPSKNAQKLKTPTKDKEPSVESPDVKEKQKETVDKDILVAYVPQRQAAKKAAEHIKSGLGKPAPDSQGNVQAAVVEEKPKVQPAPVQSRKEEKKSVVVSSGTSSESSTSSSSYSSSSSSSDSEDEEASPAAKNSVKDIKSDKAKDLPFLNKDSKSSGSVTSNDSSDSDSESSSASNASESYKKRKRKPSVSSAKAIKQTPQKGRKDINNKKPNRELDQSASNTETFKRDEPATKTPATPKSIGRGGKRSSVSCNRRQSADLRSGTLAKSAKTTSETIEASDKSTISEDNNKHPKSQQPRERKSSEASPTKQKLLNEQKSASSDATTKQSEGNSNKVDEAAKAVEHIYDNTTFEKESRKSSELSPKKRETDKKLIPTEPGSLEQEITERKAELSSVNKLNKSTGNLDKLLGKRERDMKFMTSPTIEAGSGHPVRDMEHQNVEIKAAQSVDIEIIDITGGDEKVGINLSSFNESKPSPIASELKSVDIEATRNLIADDKTKIEDQLLFSPSKAKEMSQPMIPFDDNNFGRSDFSIPTTDIQPNLSTFSFPVDNLFQQDFKEDSAKESMDLVSKLRQKFKKQQPDEIRINENDPQVIELDTSPDNTMDNEMSHVSKMSEPMQDEQIRSDDVAVDADRDDNKEENKLNHTMSVPSDERWVPPSSQSSNITSSADETISNVDDRKSKSSFQSDITSASQDFIKQQKAFSASIRAEYRTESHMIRDSDENDRSPYIRSFNDKWTENEMIQTRRSVSSSPSLASECNEEEMQQQERPPCQLNQQQQPPDLNDRSVNTLTEVHSFSSLHYQKQTQEQSQHLHMNNLNNSNHYNGPVSLFPPLGLNIQMPFPSPGTALFPPTSYHQSFSSAVTNQISRASSVHSQMPTALNKDGLITTSLNSSSVTYPSNPCGAAFTSSSHNMALTAAIVSPTIAHTPQLSVTTSHADASQSHHNVPTESNKTHLIESTNQSDTQQPPQLPLHNRENINNTPIASVKMPYNESESKTLPLKRSTRFVAQQAAQNIQQQLAKSPSKSPGKSPRNPDLLRQQQLQNQSSVSKGKAAAAAAASQPTTEVSASRGRGRGPKSATASARGGRSRGRGRGKAANNVPIPVLQEFENVANIQTDLSGTVYDLDFDEDLHSENFENLKAMRDRKKSIEHRQESMLTFRSREPSQSPKFSSSNSHKPRVPFHSDMRDLRPPSPIRRDSISSIAQSHLSPVASIHGVSPALLPVDMRTYNSTFDNTNTEAFNNSLLGAFASGTADQTLQEIDLEMEEELQSALKASNSKGKTPDATPALESSTTVTEVPEEIPPIETDTYRRSQVSLFKLKIKGPHANPDNYTSSLQPNTNLDQIPPLLSAPNLAISQIAITGTPGSNLRRMRKKELLRQYWTQDMNNDDVGYSVKPTDQPPLAMSTQASRSVGIPKAVDSMSSIPTKDDYKDYAVIDMKKRKASMSRELRLLDNPYESEMPERRRSVCSNASSNASNHLPADKRMTRTKQAQLTPTLKIKIGSMDTLMEVRPPKKRLASLPIPSLEDLKRESMSYRKQIMGEFDEAEKVVKPKKSKSSKGDRESRKEKKRKKHNAEIISSDVSHNSQKLIIRIGKRKTDDRSEEDADGKKLNNSASTSGDRIITPIRLKIARKSDGEGYVMASESDKSAATGSEKKKKALPNEDTGTAANNNQTNDSSSDKQSSENSKSIEGDGSSKTDSVVDSKESSSNDDQKQVVGPHRSDALPDPASVANNSRNSDEKTDRPSAELTPTDGQQGGTNLQSCQPLPLGKECEVR